MFREADATMDSYDFSAGTALNGSAKDMKLSSPPFLSFVVATYFLSNLIFLLTFLVNFPVVRDAITFGDLQELLLSVRENYIFALIAAACVAIIDTLVIYTNFVKRKFPSILSFAALIYNDIMCVIFAVIVYINDVRDVYFSMQVTLLIPIITILLSSVFVIDDYHDLRTGRYTAPTEKRRKGELQIADVPVMNRTSTAEIAAANAAKLAIPTLTSKPEESVDDEPEQALEEKPKLPTPEELAATAT